MLKICFFHASLRVSLFVALITSFFLEAYKPVFTYGPATAWKGALGLDFDFIVQKAGTFLFSELDNKITYDFTSNLQATLDVPLITVAEQLINNGQQEAKSAGVGDVEARLHYRFYQRLDIGKAIEIAAIGGIKLPFGDPAKTPATGTGTFDVVGYLTGSYNSRCFYFFLTSGGRFITKDECTRPGHEWYLSMAMGPRPLRLDVNYPDFVFLPELDIIHTFQSVQNGVKVPCSEATIAYIGPAFLWSLKNVMVKAAFQWPLGQALPNGCANPSNNVDLRVLLGVEANF